MKHTLYLFVFCIAVCCCNGLYAQTYIMPVVARYSQIPAQPASFDTFANTPGVTLKQITDSLHSLINPADTAEGGAMDELKAFTKFWTGRVGVNDNSGHNMFDRYLSALRGAAIAGEASPCATSGVYSGAWNKQKLFIGIHFAADLPELQINQTPC